MGVLPLHRPRRYLQSMRATFLCGYIGADDTGTSVQPSGKLAPTIDETLREHLVFACCDWRYRMMQRK